MNLLNLETEAGAVAGYTISGTTAQDVINKARAQRRVTLIKSDVISRFGGKWDANYREGWIPIVPLYNTGTADFTISSRTVTGHSTVWTSDMKGRKILAPDGASYKIASVSSSTSLVLTQPYQGATSLLAVYQIWKDEYRLYPEVLTLSGFVDYLLPKTSRESWAREMKDSYPNSTYPAEPTVHTVIGREKYTATYSTGTITASINSNVWTGVGTSWLDNIEPGFELVVGSYTYHVLRVNSDTELETYQQAVVAVVAATYSAKGKNSLVVRFRNPTSQRVVHYWYWAKDYPLVNDNDEDWIAESYPNVILSGVMFYDYIDKNDPVRLDRSKMAYEANIDNMKVAVDSAYSGVRTIPLYVPPEARD